MTTLTFNYNYWEFWAPYAPELDYYDSQKCVFDGPNKLIYVSKAVNSISVKEDVYSGWKEWIKTQNNSRFLPAIRATGGDPIPGTTTFTGDIYFLTNGWRFLVDHSISIDGVIFSDDFDSPFVQQEGTQIVINKVSSLVQTVTTETLANISVPSVEDIWNYIIANNLVQGSAADKLKQVLTTGNYLALK